MMDQISGLDVDFANEAWALRSDGNTVSTVA